jgi:hypothetical protein
MSGRGKKNQQCRFFNGNPNSCNKGDKCPFLHTSPGGSVGQKQPCRNFTPGNPHSCKFGAKCSFSHQGGGRAGDPPLANPFGPSLGNQIGAQVANPFGQAPSNSFGAATNPFGAAAGNPFGATAAPSNPFGAAAPNPFGTAAATANPFGATAGLPTSAGSKSCGMDQGPNGQQGTCQEMLNLALPASAVSRNLAEMRSGGKLWALTCLTHRSMAALTPNDVDGDKSPEVYSMHVTRLLDASIRLCVLMSSTRIQEVRWEYVKSGAGGGCCGTSSVALQIDQAIQAHVQQLSNFVAQAGSDPNFGSHLAQVNSKNHSPLSVSIFVRAIPAPVGLETTPPAQFTGDGVKKGAPQVGFKWTESCTTSTGRKRGCAGKSVRRSGRGSFCDGCSFCHRKSVRWCSHEPRHFEWRWRIGQHICDSGSIRLRACCAVHGGGSGIGRHCSSHRSSHRRATAGACGRCAAYGCQSGKVTSELGAEGAFSCVRNLGVFGTCFHFSRNHSGFPVASHV